MAVGAWQHGSCCAPVPRVRAVTQAPLAIPDGPAAAAGDEATAFEPAAPLPIAPPLLPASPMLDEREARRGATLLLGAAADDVGEVDHSQSAGASSASISS